MSGRRGATRKASEVHLLQVISRLVAAVENPAMDAAERTQAVIAGVGILGIAGFRRCIKCGCSGYDPCPEDCGWASEDLCTACVAREAADAV